MSIFQNITKLITIDLSKKIELEKLGLKQQINFIDRLTRTKEQQCFSSLKSQNKKVLNFQKML